MKSVKSRINAEPGLSFTEFSYQLLQAYDFSILHRDHGCKIQLGGSDQWGNIVAGIDLIKRQPSLATQASSTTMTAEADGFDRRTKLDTDGDKGGKEEVFGITTPLLVTDNGEKFGKSAGNAIWLDENRTSVSDFYQVRQHPSIYFLRLHRSVHLRLFIRLCAEERILLTAQFFFRTTDEKVEQYLKLFTMLPLPRIQEIMHSHRVRDRPS